MLEATLWGMVAGSALLVGAGLGLLGKAPPRLIGLVMGFGVGVLVSAVAFDLTDEAYAAAGGGPVVAGLLAGGLTFFAGDWWIDSRGGHRRKSLRGPASGTASSALLLGALLDGVPESAAVGVSLLGGGSVGVAFLVAVFLSNVPEAWGASAGMRAAGRSPRTVLLLWGGVALASTVAAGAGYALLGSAGGTAVGVTQAFAAGAILTMVADTMVPEAVEHAGRLVGLVTVLGFASAYLLSVS